MKMKLKMKYQRYRVYPNVLGLRARSFDHLKSAIQYAQHAFVQQNIADNKPVQIVKGSGSDYRCVGKFMLSGWSFRG